VDVTWEWGDGTDADTQTGVSSPATQSHTYAEPGVYRVSVTVEDDEGGSTTGVFEYIVIFDPDSGSHVTGSGSIWSDSGDCQLNDLCANAEGTAKFGFVSEYKKGATVPTGSVEFQFQAGNFNLHSEVYEWLVVNKGGTRAQFKGTATINGAIAPGGQPYHFMIWAIDGNPDRFRLKVWYEQGGSEIVVYDNEQGAAEDGDPSTATSGGNIVIHQ
jgi:PKD repeat protein